MNRRRLLRACFVLSILGLFVAPYAPDGQGGYEQGIHCFEQHEHDDRDSTQTQCPTGPER